MSANDPKRTSPWLNTCSSSQGFPAHSTSCASLTESFLEHHALGLNWWPLVRLRPFLEHA